MTSSLSKDCHIRLVASVRNPLAAASAFFVEVIDVEIPLTKNTIDVPKGYPPDELNEDQSVLQWHKKRSIMDGNWNQGKRTVRVLIHFMYVAVVHEQFSVWCWIVGMYENSHRKSRRNIMVRIFFFNMEMYFISSTLPDGITVRIGSTARHNLSLLRGEYKWRVNSLPLPWWKFCRVTCVHMLAKSQQTQNPHLHCKFW